MKAGSTETKLDNDPIQKGKEFTVVDSQKAISMQMFAPQTEPNWFKKLMFG